MLTPEEIKEIEKIAESNEAINKLYQQWSNFYHSPYFKTYITLYNQVEDWNDQLTIKEGETKKRIYNEGTDREFTLDYTPGKIDLFGSKDDKEFERAFKYFSEVITILDALDKLRAKLSPSESESLNTRSYLDRTADKRKLKASGNN